jgi:hypothetical protein
MGPLTNLLLIGIAVQLRGLFERRPGKDIVIVWVVVNAFIGLDTINPETTTA